MPPKTKTNGASEEVIQADPVLSELVATLHKMVDIQSDLLQQIRDHDEMTYRFLYVGDPEKGVQPFVTEVRAGIRENTTWIDGFKAGTQRVVWAAVLVLVTSGVGAFILYKFPISAIP